MLAKRTLIVIAVLAPVALLAPAWAADQQFQVVVHESSPVTEVSAGYLSRIFLKKVTKWPGGLPVDPIDQTVRSEVRDAFSRAVHKRNAQAIGTYWQREIFSGRALPPIEKASDADVLATVRNDPAAVGYVSPSTQVANGVKVVTVTGL